MLPLVDHHALQCYSPLPTSRTAYTLEFPTFPITFAFAIISAPIRARPVSRSLPRRCPSIIIPLPFVAWFWVLYFPLAILAPLVLMMEGLLVIKSYANSTAV